jgi:hypothetical protein
MLADAGRPREGTIASLLGLGALLFAAIGVVVQLKDALNTVWDGGRRPAVRDDVQMASGRHDRLVRRLARCRFDGNPV